MSATIINAIAQFNKVSGDLENLQSSIVEQFAILLSICQTLLLEYPSLSKNFLPYFEKHEGELKEAVEKIDSTQIEAEVEEDVSTFVIREFEDADGATVTVTASATGEGTHTRWSYPEEAHDPYVVEGEGAGMASSNTTKYGQFKDTNGVTVSVTPSATGKGLHTRWSYGEPETTSATAIVTSAAEKKGARRSAKLTKASAALAKKTVERKSAVLKKWKGKGKKERTLITTSPQISTDAQPQGSETRALEYSMAAEWSGLEVSRSQENAPRDAATCSSTRSAPLLTPALSGKTVNRSLRSSPSSSSSSIGPQRTQAVRARSAAPYTKKQSYDKKKLHTLQTELSVSSPSTANEIIADGNRSLQSSPSSSSSYIGPQRTHAVRVRGAAPYTKKQRYGKKIYPTMQTE